MKKLFYIVVAIAFWVPSFSAMSSAPGKTGATAAAATSPSVVQVELERSALERQIATMKEYHTSLLDTVYWALGTVATVAALLVGFGWFANFKFHESEKQRLKDELEARLKEAFASIDTRLSSNEIQVIKSIDLRLDAHLTRVARDVDIVRSEATGMQERNATAIEQLKSQLVALEKAKIQGEKVDSEIEAALRLVEEYVWDLKGIPTNRLLTQGQGLSAAIKAENKYYVASVLERMQKTITTAILPGKETMSARILNAMKADVDAASKIDPVAAATVRDLLEKIQTDPEEKKA